MHTTQPGARPPASRLTRRSRHPAPFRPSPGGSPARRGGGQRLGMLISGRLRAGTHNARLRSLHRWYMPPAAIPKLWPNQHAGSRPSTQRGSRTLSLSSCSVMLPQSPELGRCRGGVQGRDGSWGVSSCRLGGQGAGPAVQNASACPPSRPSLGQTSHPLGAGIPPHRTRVAAHRDGQLGAAGHRPADRRGQHNEFGPLGAARSDQQVACSAAGGPWK